MVNNIVLVSRQQRLFSFKKIIQFENKKLSLLRVESLISNITEHIIYYKIPFITHNLFNKMFEHSVSRIQLWIDLCTLISTLLILSISWGAELNYYCGNYWWNMKNILCKKRYFFHKVLNWTVLDHESIGGGCAKRKTTRHHAIVAEVLMKICKNGNLCRIKNILFLFCETKNILFEE